jgi:DNA-binding MarR family transcriptional regulator
VIEIILLRDNLQEGRLLSKEAAGKGRTERVGQLLVVAAGAAQTLATERLEPLGLSPRGWGVLSTLVESGPLTQIELATATATDRTAMVYLLDELEGQGLVERMPNPDEAERRQLVDLLTRIADHWDALNTDAAANEGARPAQALKALQNLADAAEHDAPRRPARKNLSRPR